MAIAMRYGTPGESSGGAGGSSGGGYRRDLLWTNPSPTASFAAQTVSLDLSGYDEVEIVSVRSTTSTIYGCDTIKKQYSPGSVSVLGNAANVQPVYRSVQVSDTGVTFTTGYLSGNTGNNAVWAVPVAIFGIKF